MNINGLPISLELKGSKEDDISRLQENIIKAISQDPDTSEDYKLECEATKETIIQFKEYILNIFFSPFKNENNISLINNFIDISNFPIARINFNGEILKKNEYFSNLIGNKKNINFFSESEKEFENLNIIKISDSRDEFLVTEEPSHILKKQLDTLNHLQDIIFKINKQESIDSLLDLIFYELNHIIPTDRISYAEVNYEEPEISLNTLTSKSSLKEDDIPYMCNQRIKKGTNLYNIITETQELRKIDNMENRLKDDKFITPVTKKILDKGISSTITLPIVNTNKSTIGILFFDSTKENRYTEEYIKIIEILQPFLNLIIEKIVSSTELNKQVIEDNLTGVYNRRGFENYFNKMANSFLREYYDFSKKEGSMVFLDIDHFKSFNDLYGHDMGDRVLKEVANSIKDSVREGEMVARFGGEEFLVLLEDTSPENTEKVVKRIQNNIRNLNFECNGEEINITVSSGIINFDNGVFFDTCNSIKRAELSEHTLNKIIENNLESILKITDEAMYASKSKGRDTYTIFNISYNILEEEGGVLPIPGTNEITIKNLLDGTGEYTIYDFLSEDTKIT